MPSHFFAKTSFTTRVILCFNVIAKQLCYIKDIIHSLGLICVMWLDIFFSPCSFYCLEMMRF